jgi:cytochrome b involved in lipid metabolism
MDQLFTVEQVASHSTPNDAWVIFQGNVYDITKFIALHPGGAALNDYLGQDVEKVWTDGGFLKHLTSNKAYSILSGYKIGKLVENFSGENGTSNFSSVFLIVTFIILVLGLTIFFLSSTIKTR